MSATRPLVVIFEDDEASAEALAFVLADWGAEVIRATALDPLRQALGARVTSVRCIITDFNLGPGPDGVTLSRALSEQAPDARILVLSGSFHGRAIEAAAEAGYELMQKPAQAAAIIAWLERE